MEASVYYAYNESFRKNVEEPPTISIYENNSQGSENGDSGWVSSSNDSLVIKPVGGSDSFFSDPNAIPRG